MRLPAFLSALFALGTMTALPAQRPLGEDALALVEACNAFAGDLLPVLGQAGNPTCSPASIAIALTMLQPGARAATADELGQVLHLPPTLRGERLLTAAADLLQGLGKPRRRTEGESQASLTITNDLWAQQGFALQQDYVAALRRAFGAPPTLLDFAADPEAARQTINRHIADATNQRIEQLIGPGLVDTVTRVVLTNALWFRAPWTDEFAKGATVDEAFHLDGDHTVTLPTMHKTNHCGYVETEQWQAVTLSFADTTICCEIVLPRPGVAVDTALTALLRGANRKDLQHERVAIALPRFKVATSHSLREPLQRLGMRTSFTTAADFSGIASGPRAEDRVHVDEVVHRSWVTVDEQGAEAAAATAVVMRVGAAIPIGEPKEFKVDRPFAFALRDAVTGLLLFVGRVDDPRGES